MPGTAKKTYADDGYNYNYPPDSPSAYSQLTTATRRDEEVEDPDAPVVIKCQAPETLDEGDELDILYDNEKFTILIPKGGVKQGEVFEALLDPKQDFSRQQSLRSDSRANSRRMRMDGIEEESQNDSRTQDYSRGGGSRRSGGSSSRYHQTNNARVYDDASEFTEVEKQNGKAAIKQTNTYLTEEEDDSKEQNEDTHYYDKNGTPMGGWRTRLFSCCDVVTQSTFWMGCFCAPVLIAQIVTRLKLTWNGEEGTPAQAALSFNKLVLALVFTMAFIWIPFVGGIFLFLYYFVVIVYVGSKVRSYMRRRYKIPSTLPTRCGDRIDDFCMMLFCGCCSTIQMARHTHDDKDHPGHACTTNGLQYDAPEIV